ncbi:MAG: MerR family transcriptional regulator [Chromatiales bacterium]|nr:MerR family transcriptional regulator [Chromatiales bacterium]
MLTITKLAKRFGISRTTILYYEKVGLLLPASRTDNGYRWYDDKESQRLEQILAYRSFGMSIDDIKQLLDLNGTGTHDHLLRRQFNNIEREIQSLRLQQKAIVDFIGMSNLLENEMVTKDRWVEIMRAAGLSDEDMHNWHRQFEKMEPEAHQEFLESLSISADEIKRIRSWSQS